MTNNNDPEEPNDSYGSIETTRPKKPAIFRRRSSTESYLTFVDEFFKSHGGWQIIIIGMLTALGMGSVIGIIPQIATQKYAEALFGYASEEEPCNTFLTNEGKPEACLVGGEHAQNAASVFALVKNVISLLCNPVAGGYSDVHGRRGVQIFCLFLLALSPAALVLIQLDNRNIHPFWYFAVDSITGMVSFFSIAYSQLSDIMPAKHRAASFGLYFGAFFAGIGLAPLFAIFFPSHLQVTLFSFLVRVAALVFGIATLPETLPPAVAARNKEQRSINDNNTGAGHQQVAGGRGYLDLVTILLRPMREMWILGRNETLILLTIGAFLSKLVWSADITLFFYYVETELGVRDTDVAGMMLVTGILGVLVQAVFLKYFISFLGERGLLITSYVSGIMHNLIYGLAPNKTVIYVGLCLSQLSNTSGPLLSSLASRNVDDSEHGRMQGALFALAALAEGIGPLCFNFVYRNWHFFGRGTMFVVAAMLYGLGTVAVALIPRKEDGNSEDDCEKEMEESTIMPLLGGRKDILA